MANAAVTTNESDLDVLKGEFGEAERHQDILRPSWDDKESILISKLADSISPQFKSRVSDGRLSTLAFERAARVMAQLPTGNAYALTKKDAGKSALMQLVHDRYIVPNANAQFEHLTKLRLLDLYSMVYGVMPIMYDYSITDRYIGPDSWIIPIRNWFPQPGKLSIEDSDYNYIETWYSVSFLKTRIGMPNWNSANLQYIVDKVMKDGGHTKSAQPFKKRSVVEVDREPHIAAAKGRAGQVRLVTKYESGHDGKWITFAPDYDELHCEVRNIKNPHKNAEIPIILKHSFPLIDSIYGLGDFERGKTLQFAMDSLINLYMDGVKMSIFPPMYFNPKDVIMSTMKYAPAAKWFLKNSEAQIKRFEASPQGLSTFQSTYTFLQGALLNQSGTTDTQLNAANSSDSQFGKTPEAIRAQSARETARDNWDRYMMEKTIEKLYERQINLLSTQQEKPINFHIFDAEIKELEKNGLKDVMDVFDSGKAATVTITKNDSKDGKKAGLGGAPYRFILDAGTTMQQDETAQHQALGDILVAITKDPTILQSMQQSGTTIDLGELFKRYIISSGVKDWEKIVIDMNNAKTDKQGGASGNTDQAQAQAVDPTTGQPIATPAQPATAGASNVAELLQAAIQSGVAGQPGAAPNGQAPAAPAPAAVPATAAPGQVPLAQDPAAMADLSNHPIIKVMETLQIKFESLPEDAKKWVIQQTLGFTSTDPSPAATDQVVKHAKAVTDVHKAMTSDPAHKAKHDIATHVMKEALSATDPNNAGILGPDGQPIQSDQSGANAPETPPTGAPQFSDPDIQAAAEKILAAHGGQ